jgi:hypothetical protein
MTIPKIFDMDLSSGEQTYREMTPEELKALEEAQEIKLQELRELNAKIAAKAELLIKLGITEDEAKLLIG